MGPSQNLVSFEIGASGPISLAQLQASASAPISIAGRNGTLTLNGYDDATSTVSYTYTYTLTAAANHAAGAAADQFAILTTVRWPSTLAKTRR